MTLLCWPLDNSVYFSQVESTGFNLITPDSELVCSYDDALSVLQQSREQIVIVSGGALTGTLESVGYPANADTRQQLSDTSRYRTRAPLRVYTQLRCRIPVRQGSGFTAAVLFIVCRSVFLDKTPGRRRAIHGGDCSTGHGSSQAGPGATCTETSAARRRSTDAVWIATHRVFADAATMELYGETTPQRWPRLETVLRQFKVVPEATGREWQISLQNHYPRYRNRTSNRSMSS